MNTFDTLKDQLDAAWEQITESDRFLELMREAGVAFRANEAMPREYLRLEKLHAAIAETAALMSDDDIAETLDTIANEKDEKMAEYSIPAEHEGVILWDKYKEPWVKSRIYDGKWVPGTAPYEVRNEPVTLPWVDLLCEFGPLTTTLPVKEGDTGLTAEQVWDLPKGSVIWPENAERPEPWMRFRDHWESISTVAGDAGSLQCACGDSFRVLILGGDK